MSTSNRWYDAEKACTPNAYCGTNARYAHGCKGEPCGLARLAYQRARRGTQMPPVRPSKYDTPTPPEVIEQWRKLLGQQEES